MRAGAFALLGLLPGCRASFPVPEEFLADLRCPFARVWLEHGPEKAGDILGVTPHAAPPLGRRLAEGTFGRCTYRQAMPPPGMDMCVEMRGDTWTQASASSRCTELSGTLAAGSSCELRTNEFAGWCSMKSGTEYMPLHTSASSDCKATGDACRTWSQGTFIPAGQCSSASPAAAPTGQQGSTGGTPPPGVTGGAGGPPPGVTGGAGGPPAGAGPAKCTIAPGAIGAAHQLGYSPGYSFNCEGTPAQQSPYMWPLRWSAMVKDESMEFGSDAVKYESRGKTWYMLDRNWKRGDTWYRNGIQRTVGQSPCSNPVEGQSNACNRTGTKNSTVLHRGNKMVFIDYADDGSITNCSWLDMAVIGNVRPDWFMDNRGDSTDVQYMGDSHVFWRGKPKLVKQWRKKDFASQYFTMSIQRLPGPDGVNWPLILNVPGEGFGDDHLRQLWGHELLSENDTAPFLIDEEYVRNGGSCPKRGGAGGSASSGPPTSQFDPVPSNLDVDAAAWVTKVWTGSPVWTAPKEEKSTSSDTVQQVATGVEVKSCWDESSSALQLTLTVTNEIPVWSAIGFRKTSECLMTPRGNGDGEIVYADPTADGSYSIAHGPMGPDVKHFQSEAVSGLKNRLMSFDQVDDMLTGSAGFSSGKVTLQFARKYASKPAVFNLSYAYGKEAKVGYHHSRGCFTVTPVACPVCMSPSSSSSMGGTRTAGKSNSSTTNTPSATERPVLTSGSQSRRVAIGAWVTSLLLAACAGLRLH